MREEDRVRFLAMMEKLKASLPSQMKLNHSEEILRIEVFWEEFKRHDIELVEDAMQKGISALEWFPSPMKIREFLQEGYRDVEDRVDHLLEDKSDKTLGKEKAKEILTELNVRWEKEEKTQEEIREKEFRENRKRLRKQAKLIREAL